MYDVAIIGGGPGGSTAGIVLARAGLKVTILEREKFPRFHIGESMLPLSRHLYDRLDLAGVLDSEKFTRKNGAQFVSSDGEREIIFDFSQGGEDPYRLAFEVERDRFDQILLDQARAKGAEVREETTVLDAEPSEDKPCRLRIRNVAGEESTIESRWIIDASGQGSFLAQKLKIRRQHPSHRKLAVFSRYKGASRRPGRQSGNIDIVMTRGGWFWMIPLRNDEISVGIVATIGDWKDAETDTEGFLDKFIRETPYAAKRLAGSVRSDKVRTLSNYSYDATQFVGPGYALVGDAASFLDPIFSTGVMIAMRSGELAATLLASALKGSAPVRASALAPYERRMRGWIDHHFKMINAYYTPGFSTVFFNPRNYFGMVDAVISLLAGQSEMGFLDRMRVRLFYTVLWLHRKFGIVGETRSAAASAEHF